MGSQVAALVPFVCSLALSTGTKSTYASHANAYDLACQGLGIDPLKPPSEEEICAVVLFYGVSHSIHSIDSFLSGVSTYFASKNWVLPRPPELKSLKLGLKRCFLAADEPVRAYPLSSAEVQKLLSALDQSSPPHAVFGSWLATSFIFLLRPEDFEKLLWSDIKFYRDGSMDMLIRPGKNATVGGCKTFSASASESVMNPTFWLKKCALLSPAGSRWSGLHVIRQLDPLARNYLKPLSRSALTSFLIQLFKFVFGIPPPSKLTAYSMRRGGSTAYYDSEDVKEVHLSQLMRHKQFQTTTTYIDSLSSRAARLKLTSTLL